MADYYSPTVVQQPLPLEDITPLEKLVLTAIFETEELETEQNGRALYCFASENVDVYTFLDAAEVREALEQSSSMPSRLYDLLRAQADHAAEGQSDFALDLSVDGFDFILQDILRRSKSLNYISVATAFTCSKIHPNAFGGIVALITPEEIRSESTSEILERLLADAFP